MTGRLIRASVPRPWSVAKVADRTVPARCVTCRGGCRGDDTGDIAPTPFCSDAGIKPGKVMRCVECQGDDLLQVSDKFPLLDADAIGCSWTVTALLGGGLDGPWLGAFLCDLSAQHIMELNSSSVIST